MNHKNTVHLIGNAHIDPVWLWRFQDGFAEIKATFRSALDRIRENRDFIFTSACASYYQWVEENCPEMFREIQAAVKQGRWCVIGGMWLQPDCNIPSTESFARHMLYSQTYFREKFGIQVDCGYNVDSFGHSAALPRLLNNGGITRYIYMRPGNGAEMDYPFEDDMFIWKCGESQLQVFRITDPYCLNMRDEEPLKAVDAIAKNKSHDTMLFYGVGNHGGGPTITNLKVIDGYSPHADCAFTYSTPDKAFDAVAPDALPCYEGELQNHASGCYSAGSFIKALNRSTENRLNEAERLDVLANRVAGMPLHAAENKQAWENVLFNQFHDIMCGCALREAYQDAAAFGGAAKAHALKLANSAMQKISWSIDTSKGITPRTKEMGNMVWEAENMGTPVVVFNPLSRPVRVPSVVRLPACSGVTDEQDRPIPYQIVRADYTNGGVDKYSIFFREEIPAYGWRTFWVYQNRVFDQPTGDRTLQAEPYTLKNDCITLTFDRETGNIAAITDDRGQRLLSGSRTMLIDDTANDTWAHNRFVFDKVVGAFSQPSFRVTEQGPCRASVQVTQFYKQSRLVQTYTLYPHESKVYVASQMYLNEPLVMVRHTFQTGLQNAAFTREVPGGIISRPDQGLATDGRELPMLRWMSLHTDQRRVSVINDSQYSAFACKGEMGMIAARSCYYADHYGERDEDMRLQDLGEHDYRYVISFDFDQCDLTKAAEALNTDFLLIPETYHQGPLPQSFSMAADFPDNVTVSAVKPCESGSGYVVRLTETGSRNAGVDASILGAEIHCELTPDEIKSFIIEGKKVTLCDFCEAPKKL